MLLNIDPVKHPNVVGEYFRGRFFDETSGRGCYRSFALNVGVICLPDEIIEEETWKCFSLEIDGILVKMRYYWDGDGTLCFSWSGGFLINYDCKKDYRWEYSVDEFIQP